MLKHMCAWCWYTRGRFERTHGDALNLHTGVQGGDRQICLPKFAHVGYHVLQRFTKEPLGPLPIVSFVTVLSCVVDPKRCVKCARVAVASNRGGPP